MKKSAIFFGIVEAILFFALAIFLVAAPASALNLIITLGGILLIASGIIIFIYYFTSKDDNKNSVLVAQGVLNLILGILLLVANTFVVAVALAYLLVFVFLVVGIMRLVESLAMKGGARIAGIILSLIVIGISISALFNAGLATGIFIWMLVFQFIFLAVERLVVVFASKESLPKE